MRRVLIVDDDLAVLSSTAALLRDLDFDVATCSNARDIREAIERVMPDVVLQDARMPGLDLEGLIRDLRADARWRSLPLVVFSASIDVHDFWEQLDVPYLEKPFSPSDAVRVIEDAMASSQVPIA